MHVVLACFSHCWPGLSVVLWSCCLLLCWEVTKTKYCEDKSVPAVVIVGLALHKARSCHGAEHGAVTELCSKKGDPGCTTVPMSPLREQRARGAVSST